MPHTALPPASSTPPPPSWYWSLPYAAVALFIAAMAALLWLIHREDAEEQRATLITDVLWMEQNFSFQFERNNALLVQLGPELLADSPAGTTTEARLKRALDPESGIVRVLWLDPDGKVKGAAPPFTNHEMVGETTGTFPSAAAFRLARSLGRPVYSESYAVLENQTQFEVHQPIFEGGRHLGTVVGVYSLNALLARQVPWWFSERYRVSVTNNLGVEIAAKSKVSPLATLAYEIPFEPPGHGLNLVITAYKSEVRWIPLLLMGLPRRARRRHRVEPVAAASPHAAPPGGRAGPERRARLPQGDGRLPQDRHARPRPERPYHLREPGLLPDGRLERRRAGRHAAADAPTGRRRPSNTPAGSINRSWAATRRPRGWKSA